MRSISALSLLFSVASFAQTTHQVEVGGSLGGSPLPYYSPQTLTIDVGDIVEWNNIDGTHNVYGELDIFPDNPVGFSSGLPDNDPWTWSFTFTVPGIYDYHCTQEFMGQFHSTTQFGTITVVDPNGIVPVGTGTAVSAHPNPATEVLTLDLKGCTGAISAEVIGSDGQVKRTVALTDGRSNTIDLQGLPAGQYYLVVDRTTRKKIIRFVKL